jgi:hypothetical protein
VPIAPENPSFANDPNPRGNTRGARAVEILPDGVLVCDYHTLRFFDRELRSQRQLSDGLMVGIHETWSDERRIWVTSTAIDAAICYDLRDGRRLAAFFPREMSGIASALGLEPLALDKTADNRERFVSGEHLEHPSHLHLNAVAEWRGEVFALANSFGALLNLSKDAVALRDPHLRKAHNLEILADGTAFVSDTHGPGVGIYDLRERRFVRAIDLLEFPVVRSQRRLAELQNAVKRPLVAARLLRSSISKPLFVRGLDVVGDDLFVAFAPATVLRIRWKTGELIDSFVYSRHVDVTVHGLAATPA